MKVCLVAVLLFLAVGCNSDTAGAFSRRETCKRWEQAGKAIPGDLDDHAFLTRSSANDRRFAALTKDNKLRGLLVRLAEETDALARDPVDLIDNDVLGAVLNYCVPSN